MIYVLVALAVAVGAATIYFAFQKQELLQVPWLARSS
jgi:hypothetical protein